MRVNMPDNKKFNPSKVQFWLAEIKSSENRKIDEMMKRNSYPEIVHLYEGMEMSSVDYVPGLNAIKAKLAYVQDYFPNTNQLLSEISYKDPEPLLDATRPHNITATGQMIDVEANSDTMKGALKYAMRQLDLILENRIAGFDMLYAGICFVEINHKVENTKPPVQPLNLMDKVKNFLGGKDEAEKERAQEEPETIKGYSLEEETYARRWNPLDVGIDYRAERIKDVRFVYKKIKESYADFIAKYPQYEGKVHPDAGEVAHSAHKNEAQRKMVLYYEVQHKLKNGAMENFIIAPSYPEEEIDYWVRRYKTNGFNMKISVLDEYGRLYPKSRAAIAKPNHDDKVNYQTFMMDTAEKSIPKIGYNKSKVKEDGMRGLESKTVGALVPCDGGEESTWALEPPKVSLENKELLARMTQDTEEIWGVSKSRIAGLSSSQFATEMNIQEQGFQERRIDIQEGLRRLWRQELDGLKDIIVSFWDKEYFFKITGGDTPTWYVPQVDPITGIVLNPLTDILTADYEVDIDVISMLKPNKEKKLKDIIAGATWLIQIALPAVLMPQGQTISVDEIKRISKEIGFDPEKLIVPLQMPPIGAGMGGGETLPPNPNILPQGGLGA